MFRSERGPDYFARFAEGYFPAEMGIKILEVAEHFLKAEMPIRQSFFAPNGFVHAGSIITLADTVAGFAVVAHLPESARSFTTIELKSNFVGASREGILECVATPEHIGRTTQVWRAEVTSRESKKKVAIFSCTQLLIY